MDRTQLEHVIRAAAAITGAERFVLVGSQAILGVHASPPAVLLHSMELDLYSPDLPEASDLIDGSIGEGSPFHQTFGYHGHGVGEETAVLPKGWKERLIAFSSRGTGGATALCPEPNDLAVSKLVAGRDKDLSYVSALLQHGLVSEQVIQERIEHTELNEALRRLVVARLARAASGWT